MRDGHVGRASYTLPRSINSQPVIPACLGWLDGHIVAIMTLACSWLCREEELVSAFSMLLNVCHAVSHFQEQFIMHNCAHQSMLFGQVLLLSTTDKFNAYYLQIIIVQGYDTQYQMTFNVSSMRVAMLTSSEVRWRLVLPAIQLLLLIVCLRGRM